MAFSLINKLFKSGSSSPTRSQVKLLEGEEVAERLGGRNHSLFLTNKRIIHMYQDKHTSVVSVAFVKDIVSARVERSRRRNMYLNIGIVCAIIGFIWVLTKGFGLDLNPVETSVILMANFVIVFACLVLFLTSNNTHIILKTANDIIIFPLGASDNMYNFVNRWLELKDKVG